jgi:hypothetical protein
MVRWYGVILVLSSAVSGCGKTPDPPAVKTTDNWGVIARMAGNRCHVARFPVLDTIRKIYETDLSTNHATEKLACQKAKDLHGDDATGTERTCFVYSTAAVTDCQTVGVSLPK